MATLLYINKKLVDLGNTDIVRKIQIADISEIDKNKSSFSYTIKLPKTSKNKIAFDFLGEIGNASLKPYEEVVADLVIDGINVIVNGFAIVRETASNYNINLIDGFRSLSNLLTGLKLTDLDLTDLEHNLTPTNYINSYSNTEGYIYCIGKYSDKFFGTDIEIQETAPSIYIHTLFKRIINEAGYDLNGDFFTTNTDFLKEVLTPSRGFTVNEFVIIDTDKGNCETNLIAESDSSPTPIVDEVDFSFTDIDLVDIAIDSGLVFGIGGDYDITIDNTYNVTSGTIEQIVLLNGSQISIQTITGSGTGQHLINGQTIAKDDVLTVKMRATGVLNGGNYEYDYSISADLNFVLKASSRLIKPSEYLGDMNQIDLIKDVVNRYGLIVKPMNDGSDFEFKPLNEVLNSISNAEDWSSKLSGIQSETYLPNYAKINKALFNYDESIKFPTNDGELLIDNVNLNENKTLFASIFEIPALSFFLLGEEVYSIPLWNVVDSELQNAETPLKVMSIKRVDGTINAYLFGASPQSQTDDIPFLSLEQIDLQYSIDTYYEKIKDLFEKYREKTFLFNLSVIDIYNLDFFKLKYLRQTGRYYYLNSVQYTEGKVSKVVMLELP